MTQPSSPAAGGALRAPDTVTPASAWRAATKEGFVIELPSGKRARVRRTLDIMEMIKQGTIPNPLAGMVREMIATRSGGFPALRPDQTDAIQQMLELVDGQIPRIFVEPEVQLKPAKWDEENPGQQWEPDEGCIALADVDMSDKMYAFGFAQGAAADLETFRARQAASLATVQSVVDVEDPAIDVAGDPGPVGSALPERGDVDVRAVGGTADAGGSGGESEQAAVAGRSAPKSAPSRATGGKPASAARKRRRTSSAPATEPADSA